MCRTIRVCRSPSTPGSPIIDEVRRVGASLRMIADGDVSAALAPAMSNSKIDLYARIAGAPEGVLAAEVLRCLGGGMQAKIWPRD
jgi:fructose-1,6-bisphosphatase II